MKITIYGAGYVGLVTGVCLADVGNDVVIVDINKEKINQLQQSHVPIYEPGLDALIVKNTKAKRLSFTAQVDLGVGHGQIQFICVGTPPDATGAADLTYVLALADDIGRNMTSPCLVVNKSTVPVGTAQKVKERINAKLMQRQEKIDFAVVSNPEFLKEGAAIEDFMKPDRIIIGTDDKTSADLMRELYAPFNRNHDRLMFMDLASAELTKYAANAMLATKISFMNELSHIAEQVDADIEQVRLGMGADPRIGYHFIYPGCGYGGSCFPKDVNALCHIAKLHGYEPALLTAVETVNKRQKQVLFDKINHYFKGNLRDKTIALWGLAFKPNTDDMREAPSCTLMELLWQAGSRVQAYDPVAMAEASHLYIEGDNFVLCDSASAALIDADILVIVTEWREFQSPDFNKIKKHLKNPVVFDGRNLYDPALVANFGFTYFGIGRGNSVKQTQKISEYLV